MIRKIIKIDQEKCKGCGLCADACKEEAIAIVDGKAKLVRDEYCDGLGNCLPLCPTRAISFEEPETPAKNHESELRQWPIQIRLIPANAPFFENAHLLIAADCTAYTCGEFHNKFMKNKIVIIGCPKLDSADYSAKLTEIIAGNSIKSVAVVRIEVPCCSGMEQAAITALKNSGKILPWQSYTLTTGGKILED